MSEIGITGAAISPITPIPPKLPHPNMLKLLINIVKLALYFLKSLLFRTFVAAKLSPLIFSPLKNFKTYRFRQQY